MKAKFSTPGRNVRGIALPSGFRLSGIVSEVLMLISLVWAATNDAKAQRVKPEPRPAAITVVMDDNYPPYTLKDENGNLQGITIDQWRLWEERTGIKVELIGMDWAEAQLRMKEGEFDVIDTLFKTEERLGYLDFTEPYAKIEQSVFFRTGISGITDMASLRGFAVASKTGGASTNLLRERGIETLLLFPNYEQIVAAAGEQKVNVFVMDDPAALYLLNQLNLAAEFKKSQTINSGELHRAVRRGNPALLQVIQQGFADLSAEELRVIDEHWFGQSLANDGYWRRLGQLAIVLMAVALVLVTWVWLLRREVNRRTRELKENQALLEGLVDHSVALIFVKDLQGRYLMVNRHFSAILGRDQGGVVGQTDDALVSSKIAESRREQFQQVISSGKPQSFEEAVLRSDGSGGDYLGLIYPLRNASGQIFAVGGIATDISEQKNIQAALDQAKADFERAQRVSQIGSWELVLADGTIKWSDELYRIFRIEPDSGPMTHARWVSLIHPDDLEKHEKYAAKLMAATPGEVIAPFEYRTPLPDGQLAYLSVETQIDFDDQNSPIRWLGTVQDISAPKRTELALRESEEKFAALAYHSIQGITLVQDEQVIYVNPAVSTITGFPEAEIRELSVEELLHPEDRERMRTRKLGDLTGAVEETEVRIRRKDGDWRWVRTATQAINLHHRPALFSMMIDVTERKNSEAELVRREEQFRSLLENAADLITVIDEAGVIFYQSPSSLRLLGYAPEDLIEHRINEFIHPDDVLEAVMFIRKTLETPNAVEALNLRFRHQNGEWRILQSIGRYVPALGEHGQLVVNSRDVTETHQMEDKLRQSQKLEAIGQLAGGVAHDFNNILAAIMMQAELASLDQALSERPRKMLQEIKVSTKRAANLTRQLLAFSSRQVMQSTQVDLNEIVTGLTNMLSRIVGEDVRMELELAPQALWTHADAGMLDQVLLNLVVNARDAMPQGGELIIRTTAETFDESAQKAPLDLSPGRYVGFSVTDTGEGIPLGIRSRIFEPFFTTKEMGKGTGLGLATVFGIVKQHGGVISFDSKVGEGSTFHVYLPESDGAPKEKSEPILEPRTRGGSETILLVEDDYNVRLVTRLVLEQEGYVVLEAEHGPAALSIWKAEGDHVDLLLTDMVMPEGMSGRDLAARLRAIRSDLKVIFTSGYSAEIAGKQLELNHGQAFIPKPCPPQELLKIVRQTLDSG